MSESKALSVELFENIAEANPAVSDRASRATRQINFEKGLSLFQSVKIFWRCSLWALYGQLVVFGYGIDANIAGTLIAIPQFRIDYGRLHGSGPTAQWVIPAYWQSIYGAVSQIGAILGAVTVGWLTEKIGRRWCILISCAISIGGVGIQYASAVQGSLPLITAGKAVNGIPIGMWMVLAPLYASEVAPLKLRAWATMLSNTTQFMGILMFTGIMYELGPRMDSMSYTIPLACQWIIPCFILGTAWFWPESPVWLVRTGRKDAARKALGQLHGSRPDINLEGILAMIEETCAAEAASHRVQKEASYMDCFRGSDHRRTLICLFLYASLYLSGVIFIGGYQSYYYQLIGFGVQKSFELNVVFNSIMLFGSVCSWFIVSYLPRRTVAVWGQLVDAVALFIIGGTSLDEGTRAYLALVSFMFIWGFFYQISIGTVAFSLVGELPSYRLRSRTQGLANVVLYVVSWAIGFAFPYMFNPDAGNLGGRVAFLFGTTTFCCFVGTWLFVPETKDRSTAEIDRLFEMGISSWKFADTRIESSNRVGRTGSKDHC